MTEQQKSTPGAAKPQPTKAGGQTGTGKGADKPASTQPTKATTAKAPTAAQKKASKTGGVKIVEKTTHQPHKAQAKPTLSKELKERLTLRAAIASRRPKKFRRQQWYEYKRLADSGWRKPRGVDSAMRRHFGYEQPVVRIGFRGPIETRGLHQSGFREVYVEQVAQLAAIDPKTQAARVSGRLGARTLKTIYAEADKLGVRVLNRRKLE